ncbi:MAG: outer membrane beta-barrel protein [Gammaproteobacteria bacterium]|nr:outer membrane beta-barrel protein [Gammaproteobacteria bacterium]
MMLRLELTAWALLPCLGLCLPAFAAEPRYTYAEIGYLNVDFDDLDEDGDGFGIGGSYALHRNFHLVAEYQDIDLGGSRDANALALGAGINYALRPGLDAVGRVRWIDSEVDVGSRNEDDSGYGLEGGIRTMINPQLELNGFVRYTDIYGESDTSLAFGGLYGISNNIALGGELELSDDVTALFLQARVYFNPPRQMR